MNEKRAVQIEGRRRLVIVSILLCFLFCLVIVQFFKIQVFEGEKWVKKAQAQHRFIHEEPFKRGRFFSSDGKKPLVLDVLHFHLCLDPASIPEELKKRVAENICALLHADGKEKRCVEEQFEKKSRFRTIARWLPRQTKEGVLSWWRPFAREHKIEKNALFFVEDYKRSYPFGSLLGQVLHSVRDLRDEKTGQYIPTGGLELAFDPFLQGKPGQRELLRSPSSSLETGRVLAEPEHGADITLTIDHTLQAICEEEIAIGVKRAEAKGGWAVMMDPFTGEILALAQYPSFYPEQYAKYFNDPEKLEHTKVKAVTDVFEPGSTVKPLTLAICLSANEELKRRGEKPLFSPFEKVDTHPCRFPGRSKPISDLRLHPYLNMYMALQKSSNVYMAKMVERVKERLGEKWYREQLSEVFGFGKKTGLELPSESPGLLPTPGKKNPNGTLEWSLPTPYSLAMGHNLLTNSIQIVRAYAFFANGGYAVQPTLVRSIVRTGSDGEKEVLFDNANRPSGRRVLSQVVVKEVFRALKGITKPGGTSPKGDIYGYTEVGKSSTAEKIVGGQYSKKVHFSSFVGFAPAQRPRFVLFVGIDEPKWQFIPGVGKVHQGGECAAPVFREIGLRVLSHLGVEPDDPFGYPPSDPRFDRKRADWMSEVGALQELYRRWNG